MQKPRKSSDRSWSNGLYERLRGKLGVSRIRSERDIVSLIEKRLPSASIRNLLQGGFSSSEIYELIADNRRARGVLDWTPAVALDEGLRLTVAGLAR